MITKKNNNRWMYLVEMPALNLIIQMQKVYGQDRLATTFRSSLVSQLIILIISWQEDITDVSSPPFWLGMLSEQIFIPIWVLLKGSITMMLRKIHFSGKALVN